MWASFCLLVMGFSDIRGRPDERHCSGPGCGQGTRFWFPQTVSVGASPGESGYLSCLETSIKLHETGSWEEASGPSGQTYSSCQEGNKHSKPLTLGLCWVRAGRRAFVVGGSRDEAGDHKKETEKPLLLSVCAWAKLKFIQQIFPEC